MVETTWQFAGFEFSSTHGLSYGTRISLQKKPRGLLELLLRARGGIVGKDAIAAALWIGEPPSDASIARAVNGLRKVLSARGGDIVRTIYGEGVQLSCPVEINRGDNPEAQVAVAELLRTAWEALSSRTEDGHLRALKTLCYAAARFPDSAPVWAWQADVHASMAIRGLVAPAESAARIEHCCKMALRADPYCNQALAVSGWSLGMLTKHNKEGLRRLDACINEASGWQTFLFRSYLQVQRRDLTAAIEDLEQGLARSPLERSLLAMYALVLVYQGKLEEAEAFARKAQEIRDDIYTLWTVRSIIACEVGDNAKACVYAERAVALVGRDRMALSHLAYAYATSGQADRARMTLTGIGPGVNGHTPALLAAPYLALGEVAEAVRILHLARAELCPYRAIIWCDPRFRLLWSAH